MSRQKIRKALIIISFLLFPIVIFYFSPYLIALGASEGIIAGSFFIFTGVFVLSLFFGRLFCGWMCPVAGLEEALFSVNDKKIKKGNWIKFLIWVPWIVLIVFLFYLAGGIKGIDFFFHSEDVVSLTDPLSYIIYYAVLILVVVPTLILGKRAFCHHICWISPFMIIGRKIRNIFKYPSLRLIADESKCINCKICDKNCPMSLDVNDMVMSGNMEHSECILCGNCIDTCPKKAIRFGF